MIGLGYVFYSTGMSHGQYFKKPGSGKEKNRMKNMDNKARLTFQKTHKIAHMEKKVVGYVFLEYLSYFLLFAFFKFCIFKGLK